MYELEFTDVQIEKYYVYFIYENLLNMANSDGWDTGLLKEIEDFRSDELISIPCDQGFTETL